MMNRTDRHAHAGRAEQMMKATRDMTGLKDWAPIIKRDVHAVYLASRDAHANLASRDPRWYANVLAIVVIWINAITIAAASIALAYRYFAA